MLLKKTYHIIGLQLLLLIHIAHSFVLLTANIEDVKKLASKFMSESLAEKIAGFIAKATEQMVTNVSAENEMNDDKYPYASNMENAERFSEARQRHVKKKGYNTDVEFNKKKPRKIERKQRPKERIDKRSRINIEKQAPSKDQKNNNRHPEPIKPAHAAKEYVYLTFNKPSQIKYIVNQKKTVSPMTIKSTLAYAEIYKHDGGEPIRTPVKNNVSNSYKLSLFSDEEHNNNTIALNVNVALPKTSDTSDSSYTINTSSEIITNDLEQETTGPLKFPKIDMRTF